MGKIIMPQPGPQTLASSCPADIILFGGQAGGGKSFWLVMEAARHISVHNYAGVLMRRTMPEITQPGGLWDETQNIYPGLGGVPRQSPKLSWTFPLPNKKKSTIGLFQMQHEKNRFDWKGAQVPFFGIDEATSFTWPMILYMISRMRSMCGVRPSMRMTTNPDPDHPLREFIDWWIDSRGYPRKDRAGIIRWFKIKNDKVHWGASKKELEQKGLMRPKSFTFIPSALEDNQILMQADPDYEGNLEALPQHEVEKLRGGNWDARAKAGDYFQKSYFEIIDKFPEKLLKCENIRYWDRAATTPDAENPDPDWTAGVRVWEVPAKYGYPFKFIVSHVERFRGGPGEVERRMVNTAKQDSRGCIVGGEQEPGASGKKEVYALKKTFVDYRTEFQLASGDKGTRATPASIEAKKGNIAIVKGKWNAPFLDELEGFTGGNQSMHDDQVDGLSGAINYFVDKKVPGIF